MNIKKSCEKKSVSERSIVLFREVGSSALELNLV